MAPTATDYLHALRRLWWVPLITVLMGVGLGLASSSGARPTTVTTGNALFTFRIDDPGDESEGSAREAEAQVAQSRLSAYVQLARSSQVVRAQLQSAGILEPPTAFSLTGGFKDGSADALIDVAQGVQGLVEIRVKNGDLRQEEAIRLVQDLAREVVRQSIATDAQQVTPSLKPDALVTAPQAKEEPASRVMRLALPILLLLTLGAGIVYLLVWRQGRIYRRRDIEHRLGARVVGDLSGQVGDAPAIALALGKGRDAGTTALLVPVRRPTNDLAAAGVGEAIADGGRDLGLSVTLTSACQAFPLGSAFPAGAPPEQTATNQGSGGTLALIDAPAGLDSDSLRAAAAVDVVALIVEYGQTSYRDLTVAGQTLAQVTDASICVIGIHRSGEF